LFVFDLMVVKWLENVRLKTEIYQAIPAYRQLDTNEFYSTIQLMIRIFYCFFINSVFSLIVN
jgi:hypothetical protein